MIRRLHLFPSWTLRGVTWGVLAALPLVIFSIFEVGQDPELQRYQWILAAGLVLVGVFSTVPVRHAHSNRSGPVDSAAGVWGVLLPLAGVGILWISPALPIKVVQALMVLTLATYVLLTVAFAAILRITEKTQGP